jgi:hypothetical protein
MPLRSVRMFVAAALSIVAMLAASPAVPAAAAETVRQYQNQGDPDASENCQTATSYAGYQWGGVRLCAYRWGAHVWSGGTIQIYVVGTDHKVWTKWRNPNGSFSAWQILRDGKVRPGKHWSIEVTRIEGEPLLRVIGDEAAERRWCIRRGIDSSWGLWGLCTT